MGKEILKLWRAPALVPSRTSGARSGSGFSLQVLPAIGGSGLSAAIPARPAGRPHAISRLMYLVAFFLPFNNNTMAQQTTVLQLKDAVLKLKEAEDKFGAGHFEEALVITNELQKESGLSRIEREQTLLISAKINLELDKIDSVDQNIVSLLRLSPNYKLNPLTVQQDLLKYFQKYFVIPRISVSLQVNYNTAFFQQVNAYKIMGRLEDNQTYITKPSFGGGLRFNYSFRHMFFAGLGIEMNEFGFSRELRGVDNLQVTYSEKLSFIEIPVTAGKRFKISDRMGLFGTCLVSGAKMIKRTSLADISVTYPVYQNGSDGEILDEGLLEEKRISRLDARNNNYRFGGAIELAKQFDNFLFGLGAGYHFTTDLTNDPDSRYDNENLMYNFNYIDDDFRFEFLQIYLSASYTIKHSIRKKVVKIS